MKEVINRNIMKCQIHAIVKSIVQAKRILKRESITYLDKTDNKNTNLRLGFQKKGNCRNFTGNFNCLI